MQSLTIVVYALSGVG